MNPEDYDRIISMDTRLPETGERFIIMKSRRSGKSLLGMKLFTEWLNGNIIYEDDEPEDHFKGKDDLFNV